MHAVHACFLFMLGLVNSVLFSTISNNTGNKPANAVHTIYIALRGPQLHAYDMMTFTGTHDIQESELRAAQTTITKQNERIELLEDHVEALVNALRVSLL